MTDRAQYFRDYQRARYHRLQAERRAKAQQMFVCDDEMQMCPLETFPQMFKRLCKEYGYEGQKAWRQRAKFKAQLQKAFSSQFQKDQLKFAKELVRRSKSNATAKKLEFTLTPFDILPLPVLCPILKITLDYGAFSGEDGQGTSTRPSIDRIDSTKGYTKDNVQVISWRANRLKNDATLEELVALGAWAKRLSKN
jgi:hypothetical protein